MRAATAAKVEVVAKRPLKKVGAAAARGRGTGGGESQRRGGRQRVLTAKVVEAIADRAEKGGSGRECRAARPWGTSWLGFV